MSKKLKVVTLSDHPLSPSGVGTQTKYIIQALLQSGKFEVISLGGAMKHRNYDPIQVDGYNGDWRIIPVDGYGTPEMIRSILRNERPDFIWMMTDPRFYEWLWSIENEIRPLCPIVYYHVWDNLPYPMFNQKYYQSNDYIACISRLTADVVRNVTPNVNSVYLPHAVDQDVFTPLTKAQRFQLRKQNMHPEDQDKFVVFWNNRNARRKQSGTLVWWWKEWLDKNNLHDKAQLIMHTQPHDQHGQDLNQIVSHLGMNNRQVLFSTEKVPLSNMATYYNLADVTVNISDAEGFGLSTLESLACGTPIIATLTGGLQEQVLHKGKFYGVGLKPVSKAIIGSQQVPYIYEDRVSKNDFHNALTKMYRMGIERRLELGKKGLEHVNRHYNFKSFQEKWVKLMLEIHEKEGSWETRRDYNNIVLEEIK
jgi:glycosyltransferase involved in cell wall biosynthesis